MLVNESYVNVDKGYHYSPDADDLYEPYTDDIGELFQTYQKEYGGCISHVYIDTPAGGKMAIGWVFSKRVPYEDTGELYTQEVWVTLHDAPDTVTQKHHYHCLNTTST